MSRLFSILFLFGLLSTLFANDGGFYTDGNHLIPILETNISVKKEILEIRRSTKNPDQVEVSVYYEFYNPDNSKAMIVGFEAASPQGDAQTKPVNGAHPYIHKFTVEMNGKKLPYEVAIVNDSLYYQNNRFKVLTKNEIQDKDNDDGADFFYVYHFQANFNKGLNIIKHTYTCDFSTFVLSNYEFGYILSAAMRWGNKQIDDFTLHIDMGEEQIFNMPKTFFDSVDEWAIAGSGKKRDSSVSQYSYSGEEATDNNFSTAEFYIKNGYLIFQKRNFKPKGELSISSPRGYFIQDFDYKKYREILPNMIQNIIFEDMNAVDDMSRRILRNLPFAKRGYIFSTPEIQQYFETQMWYLPNPNYTPEVSELTDEEKKWVKHWDK